MSRELLACAQDQFIRKVIGRLPGWERRKFLPGESAALFLPRTDAAIKRLGGNRIFYVTGVINHRLSFLEIAVGWFDPDSLPHPERVPRMTQWGACDEDCLHGSANFYFSALLANYPGLLPNQSKGQYAWKPHAPAEFQNDLIPIELDYPKPSVESKAFLENCDKITDLMCDAVSKVVVPLVLKLEAF